MILSTGAMVLSCHAYSDTSLIVKAYTRDHGLMSFLFKGIKRPGNKQKLGAIRPLHYVDVVFYKSGKSNLSLIKEFKPYLPYTSISTIYEKTAILLFLSEILQKVIKEEQGSAHLYDFIETSLQWLDASSEYVNFHVYFLISLSRYLGFAPMNNFSPSVPFLDLNEGVFVNAPGDLNQVLPAETSFLFHKVIGQTNISENVLAGITNSQRRELLKDLMQFYSFHIAGFGDVKSLSVLETIFTD